MTDLDIIIIAASGLAILGIAASLYARRVRKALKPADPTDRAGA